MEHLVGFFPSGPLTTLYALILLAVTIPCMRWGTGRTNDIAMVLFISWPMALVATKLDSSLFQAVGTIVLCGILARIGTRLAIVIIALAAVKLIIYTGNISGLLNWEQMWAFSEVFAYFQLIALFGGAINGWPVGLHLGALDPRYSDLSPFVLRPQKSAGLADSHDNPEDDHWRHN